MIQELLPQAERIAAILKARGETISVAESSTAGLISAALLAVGGASAYFMGGAVVYTRASRTELLRVTDEEFAALTGITPSTEPYALLFARKIKERLNTTWSASRSLAGSSARSRSKPAAPTGLTTCAPSRLPPSICSKKPWGRYPARSRCASPADQELPRPPAVLPAGTFQRRNRVTILWVAKTEIADQPPLRWYIERRGDSGRVEDRDPAHADPLGARDQP